MIDTEQENEMVLLFDFPFVRQSQNRIDTNRYYAILIGFDNRYTFTFTSICSCHHITIKIHCFE